MATTLEERREPLTANGELPATEKQRRALYRWGIDRERADDPALTRAEASRWLGTLIAKAKPKKELTSEIPPGAGSARRPREEPAPEPPSVIPGPHGASHPEGEPGVEPAGLEIELTMPTGIPYSTIRVRAGASRRPNETLEALGDRLTDQLAGVVRTETKRVEELFRPRPAESPGDSHAPTGSGHREGGHG